MDLDFTGSLSFYLHKFAIWTKQRNVRTQRNNRSQRPPDFCLYLTPSSLRMRRRSAFKPSVGQGCRVEEVEGADSGLMFRRAQEGLRYKLLSRVAGERSM